MAGAKKIGVVSHFFDQISVAALTLTGSLKVGDTVQFLGHGLDSTQTIDSMQINHAPVTTAKKGDDVAIKVNLPVKEGMTVEKI